MRKKSSKDARQTSVIHSNRKRNMEDIFDDSSPFVIAGVVSGAAEVVDVEEIVKVAVIAKRIQSIPVPIQSDGKGEILHYDVLINGLWGEMYGCLLHGSVRGLY